MNRKTLLFILFLYAFGTLSAQSDSIRWLDEVRLSDVKLKEFSKGQFTKKIEDSVINLQEPLLTSLLKFNSPFFLRENGYGMVSSASVRGTGAAQTAVVWNGININSQFTGQTNFNTINTQVFDEISLRPDGGSVIYGSGAIGGSIHLNNELNFSGNSENKIIAGIGSFDTYQAGWAGKFSTDETSVNVDVSGISSENDYQYPETKLRNENGDFYNISLNAAIGQWLGEKNLLKFYSNYYQGNRCFSGTLQIPSNSEYQDKNVRNLLEWKSFLGNFTSSLKLAWLDEEFKYFENRDAANFSFGKAKTGIVKYNLGYEFSGNKKLEFIADYIGVSGKGSGIEKAKRSTTGFSVLWSHAIEKFSYEMSLRQEIGDIYDSPLLFSAGGKYEFSDFYSLRTNISRNFRIPTFNDLFWQQGGNPDLQPETSLQGEVGNDFKFGNFDLSLNVYYIDLENLIRWVSDASGLWRPVNTANAHNYGLEFYGEWKHEFNNYSRLILNSTYAYTKSIDEETQNQLIYTPFHKATFSAALQWKKIGFWYRSLYNGKIFTSSDNNYELSGYFLSDLGVSYSISEKPQINLQLQVQNLFNKNYQNMPSRPMPGRHFKSTITFKF